MFTGITEYVGKIEAFEKSPQGGRLGVSLASAPEFTSNLKAGDSIAVSGCCLTIVEKDGASFTTDLSGETLRRTSFNEKKPRHSVNLERPLAAGARLGGHFVQGHVDGIGRVTRMVPEGENWWLSVRIPDDLRRYVAEKSSIAIDGISLTVADWHDGISDFAIIPFTYAQTTVRELTVGDAVNIEVDILAKYVESLLEARGAPAPARLTISRLIEEGF